MKTDWIKTKAHNSYLRYDVTIKDLQILALDNFMDKLGYDMFSNGVFYSSDKLRYKTCSRFISFNTAVRLYNASYEVMNDENTVSEMMKSGKTIEEIYFEHLNFDIDPLNLFTALYSKILTKVCMQWSKKKGRIIYSDYSKIRLRSDFLKSKFTIVDEKQYD